MYPRSDRKHQHLTHNLFRVIFAFRCKNSFTVTINARLMEVFAHCLHIRYVLLKNKFLLVKRVVQLIYCHRILYNSCLFGPRIVAFFELRKTRYGRTNTNFNLRNHDALWLISAQCLRSLSVAYINVKHRYRILQRKLC